MVAKKAQSIDVNDVKRICEMRRLCPCAVYLSGMLGNTPDNRGNAKAQSERTLAALGRGLKAAGFEWKHVVEGLVYITDAKHFPAMNEVYRPQFGKDFPTRATVITDLVNADGLVEIMLTAVK